MSLSLVPPHVARWLVVAAGALAATATGLHELSAGPEWLPGGVLLAALGLALAGGHELPQPRWAAGKPLAPVAALPALGAAGALLPLAVELLPEPTRPWAASLLPVLLAAAAGKVLPTGGSAR